MTLENQCSIAYFSLELTSQQLITRIIRQQNNYRYRKLRLGLLNEKIELISQKNRRTRRSAFIYY
jgi:replicative DNA helicase